MTQHVTEHLTAYIHGEFSEETRRQISDHLIDCPECQKEYKELMETHKLIQEVVTVNPSRTFIPQVMDQVSTIHAAESEVDWILEEMEEMESQAVSSTSSSTPWYLMGSTMIVMGVVLMIRFMSGGGMAPMPTTSEASDFAFPTAAEMFEEAPKNEEWVAEPQQLSDEALASLLKEMGVDPNKAEDDPAYVDVKEDHRPEHEEFDWPKINDIREGQDDEAKRIVEWPQGEKNDPTQQAILENKNQPKTSSIPQVGLKPPVSRVEAQENIVSLDGDKNKKTYWLYSLFNKDGTVGKKEKKVYGKNFNTTMASLILYRRLKALSQNNAAYLEGGADIAGEKSLIADQLKNTNAYLKKLSLSNGFSNDIREHAQMTYFIALLVNEGQSEFMDLLNDAVHFLMKQQNLDGGWAAKVRGGKNVSYSSSNSISTGWAVMALSEALSVKKSKVRSQAKRAVTKSQSFFKRMTNPKNGQCGYQSRGDNKNTALCTVMATMARYTVRSYKNLKRSTDFTKKWVKSGLQFEKRSYPKAMGYDFLWCSLAFSKTIGDEHTWKDLAGDLVSDSKKSLPKSRFGGLSKLSRQLYLEILLK